MSAAKNKNVLGRGLGNLLGGETASAALQGTVSIQELPLEKIAPNPDQPRKHFEQEGLEELAASLRALGLVQPITVQALPSGSYQIISGERRWRAAQLAGLKTLPAYIRSTQEGELLELALIENIQREDLNAIEVALAYQKLIEQYHLTQEELSEKVGKRRATVANALRLLKLPAPVQLALRNKSIDQGHARAILGAQEPSVMLRLFKEVQERGYSVRQVEEMVKALNAGETVKSGRHQLSNRKNRLPEEYNELKGRLSGFFQTKVQMTCSQQGKGKITINFGNEEELEKIIAMFDKMRS